MGSGALLFSLPHFITDNYLSLKELARLNISNAKDEGLCYEDSNVAENIVTTLSRYKYFFYFGQFLNGAGASPLITVGTTLLDDSVTRLSAPLYIGIYQTFFVVGPAIGYMLGGSLLEMYVDFDTLETLPAFTSSSQMWVGAWWLGFVIAWIMAWTCALFIFCYPAVLPTNPIASNKLSPANQAEPEAYGSVETREAHSDDPYVLHDDEQTNTKTYSSVFKEILLSILSLLKNPTYMFISIGGGFDGLTISGLSTFVPKFIQVQYGYTAGFAALLTGILATPSGGFGTFLGGYVAKRFQLNRNQILKMYMLCQAITIPCALVLLAHCDNPPIPGVSVGYDSLPLETTISLPSPIIPAFDKLDSNSGREHLLLNATCNANNCESCGGLSEFSPVCGSDNRMYFNPCYAGCTNVKEVNGTKEYSNCACVEENGKTATIASCDVGCNKFPYFAIFAFLIIWFTFMAAMPSVVATLRFVEREERSLALGIQSIFLRYYKEN